MHGQKRAEYKARLLHPDTRAKLGSKAQQWNHLSEELLKQRRRLFAAPPQLSDNLDTTEDAANVGDAAAETTPSPAVLLALTEKMLSVNPDPSHLWNIRREMLVYLIQSSPPPATNTADDNQKDVNDISSNSSILDIEAELKLTAHCLQRNPKSYSAWFHRKWALVYFMNGTSNQEHLTKMKSILHSELELCVQFLQLDERNFHCWNFRRFVVGLLGSCGGSSEVTITSEENGEADNDIVAPSTKSEVDNFSGSWSAWMHQIENEDKEVWMGPQISPNACRAVGMSTSYKEGSNCTANSTTAPLSKMELEKIIMNEWDFSTAKIQDNFSNGSAFHYRSKLLPLMLEFGSTDDSESSLSEACEAISLARDEWDGILLDAIFTEPDDQTIWFYHRFIVTWAWRKVNDGDGSDAEATEEIEGLLYDMVDSIQELIDVEKEDSVEGNSQDRHESKGAKCKWAYLGMHLVLSTLLELKSNDGNDEEKIELSERAKECLHELIVIDPDRRERYQILESEL